MSTSSPFGGGNPLEHLLGDLLKMISNAGPLQWDMARQLAHAVATDGQVEANVDPLERIQLQELARVADLHVSDATGLARPPGAGLLSIVPVTRSEWSSQTLDAWRPLLDVLARSLSGPPPPPGGAPDGEAGVAGVGGPGSDADPDAGLGADLAGLAGLLGSIGQVMGPTLLGLQVGSALGHLARRAMGPYVLPVPRPVSDGLTVVPANIAELASDWSLPLDEVRLWVCLNELTHHLVVGLPHVRARLEELIGGYVAAFRPDARALEERLSAIDPTDPASFQSALGDPTALLGELQTPAQRQLLPELDALVSALEGYVDHVMDTVGHRLIRSYPSLTEALRRRRAERDEGERMVERLLGLEMGQDRFERGDAFVRGVLDRTDESGLSRLWESAVTLPTPAELDAPGLWLARIELPEGD